MQYCTGVMCKKCGTIAYNEVCFCGNVATIYYIPQIIEVYVNDFSTIEFRPIALDNSLQELSSIDFSLPVNDNFSFLVYDPIMTHELKSMYKSAPFIQLANNWKNKPNIERAWDATLKYMTIEYMMDMMKTPVKERDNMRDALMQWAHTTKKIAVTDIVIEENKRGKSTIKDIKILGYRL